MGKVSAVTVFCLVLYSTFHLEHGAAKFFSAKTPEQKETQHTPVGHLWMTSSSVSHGSSHIAVEGSEETNWFTGKVVATTTTASQNSDRTASLDGVNTNFKLHYPSTAPVDTKLPETSNVASTNTEILSIKNKKSTGPAAVETIKSSGKKPAPIGLNISQVFNETDVLFDLMDSDVSNSYSGLSSSCSDEPDHRLCGCTSTCVELKNCCYDSQFFGSVPDSISRISCYESINDKWTLSTPALFVDRCAQGWTDENSRQLCENTNGDDFRQYVPCYSTRTGLTYKNIFCLMCNKLADCVPWNVTFHSGINIPFQMIDNFSEMNAVAGRPLKFRGQQFVISPLTGSEPFRCTPTIVDRCKPEFSTEMLTKMCQAYYSPIVTERTVFRNIHCFRCFTGKKLIKKDIFILKNLATPLSMVLDLDFLKTATAQIDCSRDKGTCQPSVIRIRGYAENMDVYARLESGQSLHSADITEVRRKCQDLLIVELYSSLAGIETKVSVMHRKSETDTLHFKTLVVIKEEILYENITYLHNALASVSFNFSFNVTVDDSVQVSCCYDKNGKSLAESVNSASSPKVSVLGPKDGKSVTSKAGKPVTSGIKGVKKNYPCTLLLYVLAIFGPAFYYYYG